MTGEEKQILGKLHEEGTSQKEIAEKLSLSPDTLRRRVDAMKEKALAAGDRKSEKEELPLILMVKEVTEMLQVSERTVCRWMEQEGMPHFFLRKRLFVG